MEKIIDFMGNKVHVTWEERLKPGTEVYVWTNEPGLAMSVIELFLGEKGKRRLWYESGWQSYPDMQEMTLCECEETQWEGWTPEIVFARAQEQRTH